MTDSVPSSPPSAPRQGIDAAGGSSRARTTAVRLAVFGVVAASAAFFVLPAVPRAQHVRLHLGAGSSRLVRASARIGRDGAWDRVTNWRFDHGAPPAISWDFELANGGVDLEVELATEAEASTKRVHLELTGAASDVELADVTRGLP